MGRLQAEWADRLITARFPHHMEGELILPSESPSTQMNDGLFTHNVDMPFEVHRMIPRVTGLDAVGAPLANQPSQDLLFSLVRARVENGGKSLLLTKAPALLSTFTKGSSERTWEWAEPLVLTRSESFSITLNTLALPIWDGGQIPTDPPTTPLTSLRVEIAFQGFLLAVAPPSNVR